MALLQISYHLSRLRKNSMTFNKSITLILILSVILNLLLLMHINTDNHTKSDPNNQSMYSSINSKDKLFSYLSNHYTDSGISVRRNYLGNISIAVDTSKLKICYLNPYNIQPKMDKEELQSLSLYSGADISVWINNELSYVISKGIITHLANTPFISWS